MPILQTDSPDPTGRSTVRLLDGTELEYREHLGGNANVQVFRASVLDQDGQRGPSSPSRRCKDRKRADSYAVKVLASDAPNDGALFENAYGCLRREGALLAALSHPHIVRGTLCEELGSGNPVVVTDLLDGGDVRQLLETRGVPGPLEAIRLTQETLDALDYLSTRQAPIVHRDIKPANLLLDAQGTLYLADFGIAQTSNHAGGEGDVRFAGTLMYAAPEQISDPAAVDIRSDIFSLGLVLCELLTGNPWMKDHSPDEIRTARLEGALPPMEHLRGLCLKPKKRCMQVITRACALEPAERFQTPQEFAYALDDVLALLRHQKWIRMGIIAASIIVLALLAALYILFETT